MRNRIEMIVSIKPQIGGISELIFLSGFQLFYAHFYNISAKDIIENLDEMFELFRYQRSYNGNIPLLQIPSNY